MKELEIINKEIDEGIDNISHQHQQIKFYFQTYTLALVGLFTISGYFSRDNISFNESVVGASFVFTVFFLGWVFLSIISHKVSMLILLYKHIAVFRKARLNILCCSELQKLYVLPCDKSDIVMPSMLKRLPYLVFIFNFLVLVGGLAFYLAPRLEYHQLVATVGTIAVVLGAFYPVVCVTFNKHMRCAMRASSLATKIRLEKHWGEITRENGIPKKWVKLLFLVLSVGGSIAIAIASYYIDTEPYKKYIVYAVWVGVTLFGALRYIVEIYNCRLALSRVKSIG